MSIVSKSWMLTFPVDAGFTHERIRAILHGIKSIEYWCMCDEISSQGILHTHVFIFSSSGIGFDVLKPFFSFAHIERLYGWHYLGRKYVVKQGLFENFIDKEIHLSDTFEEFGKIAE
mgnify:CR=1 FL=1